MDTLECDYCTSQPEETLLLRCSGCHIAYYCDRVCQKQDWPDHKSNCKSAQWRTENREYGEARAQKIAQLREEKHRKETEIVETTGETRKAWHARISSQPPSDRSWNAFAKRARKRKGKPIIYRHPIFPAEHVLRIDTQNALDPNKFKEGIVQVEFAPGAPLTDSDIEIIANAEPSFRLGVRAFIAGARKRTDKQTVAPEITDAGVKRLCQACPNLEVVTLRSTRNLGGRAFPEIVLNCANLQAVTMTARPGSHANLDEGNFLENLLDKEYRAKLAYCEFRGVHLDDNARKNALPFLTKVRPALEVVFEDRHIPPAVLIRDASVTPLSSVPPQAPRGEGDEDSEWEDVSDEEARQRRRENAKAFKRAGKQSALRSALGSRPYAHGAHDFDDGDSSSLDSDDDGMDDEQLEQMMDFLEQMDEMEDLDDEDYDDDDYYGF
ncbi:hypothetical protein F4778DRAFT_429316 [Xylariomycetidae sp. FL2044]|nr:hypothetical protein F4778DRAFT_429316 [Xylariomycetidae sp. FL2044]